VKERVPKQLFLKHNRSGLVDKSDGIPAYAAGALLYHPMATKSIEHRPFPGAGFSCCLGGNAVR
jgi:hypothetical protein